MRLLRSPLAFLVVVLLAAGAPREALSQTDARLTGAVALAQ